MVRACGLYHHYYAEQLEACRAQLGGGTIPEIDDDISASATKESVEEERPPEEEYCRVCGCQLEIEVLPRAPPPPRLAIYYGRK